MANGTTLHAIADRSGVSLATVSRVLNNKTNVSAETRAKVLAAATELGYRDAPGTSIGVGSLQTIGVAVKRDPGVEMNVDPFNYQVVSAIEAECQTFGLAMMYTSIHVDEYGHAGALPQMLSDPKIDGLILVGAFFEQTVLHISERASLPIVLVDGDTTANLQFNAILTDNVTGARQAVAFLIEQGHEHIGLIGSRDSDEEHISIRERRQGYLAALAAHNIPHQYIQPSRLAQSDAYTATQDLLAAAPQITAIFACNDDVGTAAMRAARDMDLSIPRDLSVMGFDDTIHGQVAQPKLSTMFVNKSLMGKMAVRVLEEQTSNENHVSMTVRLGTKLIVRESVSVPSKRRGGRL